MINGDNKVCEVQIQQEFIELYKLLKYENLVQSGGEAKFVIAEGLVQVNGEIETRKRKKLFAGDIVEFNDTQFRIVCK